MGLTAVVCDDDPSFRSLVAGLLGDLDLDVVAQAGNGSECIDIVRTTKPHLLLLDEVMPGMTGLEALPAILEASPRTRVLMLTAFDLSRDDALRAGAFDLIHKSELGDLERAVVRTAGSAGRFPLDDPSWWTGDVTDDLAWLRTNEPLHRLTVGDTSVTVLSRHADVVRVLNDGERFRAFRGSSLDELLHDGTPPLLVERAAGASATDVVRDWFAGLRASTLEPLVRSRTAGVLDRMPSGRPLDAVTAITANIPLLIVARLLGLATADLAQVRLWVDDLLVSGRSAELDAWLADAVRARRDAEGADLLTALATAAPGDVALSDAEAVHAARTVLFDGIEASRAALAHTLVLFADLPDQYRVLQEEPGLIATAADEILRYASPIIHVTRTAWQDAPLAEHDIPAGTTLMLLLLSANRDPLAFGDRADAFDVSRTPGPQVALGGGAHACLGARLARVTVRVFVEELLRRYSGIDAVGDAEVAPSTRVRTITTLPVVLNAS